MSLASVQNLVLFLNAAICRVSQTVEANEDFRFLKTLARHLIELKVIRINNCHLVIWIYVQILVLSSMPF